MRVAAALGSAQMPVLRSLARGRDPEWLAREVLR